MFNLFRRRRVPAITPGPPDPPDGEGIPVSPDSAEMLMPLGPFVLCIEPHPPYQAKLRGPGGVAKLLSNAEAYRMCCAEAVRRFNKSQLG